MRAWRLSAASRCARNMSRALPIAISPVSHRRGWEEQAWLREAQDAVRQVRVWREREMQRFWPGVLRRWCLAGLLTLATATAAGVGYAWASKPYAEELAALRSRVELADTLAQRLLTMTPAERRQFDALMKANRGTR